MDRRRMMLNQGDGKLWLYNEGDECTDITGGWGAIDRSASDSYFTNTSGVHRKDATALVLSATDKQSPSFETARAVNFSKYTKLCYEVTARTSTGYRPYGRIRIGTTYSARPMDDATWAAIGGVGITKLDISSYNGSYYIAIGVMAAQATSSATISKIWLE